VTVTPEGKAAFDAYQAKLPHDKAIELEALRGVCTLERAVPKPRLKTRTVEDADLRAYLVKDAVVRPTREE
jgi:hypothetical protein